MMPRLSALLLMVLLSFTNNLSIAKPTTDETPPPPKWTVIDPKEWKVIYAAMTKNAYKNFHITTSRMLWEWSHIDDHYMYFKDNFGKTVKYDLWKSGNQDVVRKAAFNKEGKIIAISFKIKDDFDWSRLKHLKKLKYIKIDKVRSKRPTLDLSKIDFPAGIESISLREVKIKNLNALSRFKHLKSLILDDVYLDSKNLSNNFSIEILKLRNIDGLNQEQTNFIFTKLVKIKSLSLIGMKVNDNLLESLINNSKLLRSLFIYPNSNLVRISAKKLEELKELREIVFYANNLDSFIDVPALIHLERLTINDTAISSLKGVERFPNLKYLDLIGNKIKDLSPLSALTQLEVVKLYGNPIERITGFENSKNLRKLQLQRTPLRKIEGLQNNLNLEYLEFGSSAIKKIENIAHLSKLKRLEFDACSIKTADGLPQNSSLEYLRLKCYPSVIDFSALKKQGKLREFYCGGCKRAKNIAQTSKTIFEQIRQRNYTYHKAKNQQEKQELQALKALYQQRRQALGFDQVSP